MRRRGKGRGAGLPDVVPDLPEDEIRTLYGKDADEVIAFKRFLQLGKDEKGKTLCPPHWLEYARGNITGAEALRLDDESRAI